MILPQGNRIVDTLEYAEEKAVLANAIAVPLERSQFTTMRNTTMHGVDFPVDALLSVMASADDGSTAEVALIGPEGFVEIDAALHNDDAKRTSQCRCPGSVIRIPIADFKAELRKNGLFAGLIYHAVRARVFMSEQIALCNLRHPTSERIARWLLLVADRTTSARIMLTHEEMGSVLGVRRASVTVEAGALQKSGAIGYSRGVVQILDRHELERNACECYAICRDTINSLTAPAH